MLTGTGFPCAFRMKTDWSVIRVLDRYWISDGGIPEFIFTWRGHLDADLVAWKSMQVATLYHNALLVIESNYYDARKNKDVNSEDYSITVTNIIAEHYDNLYVRTHPEKISDGTFSELKRKSPLLSSIRPGR